jgi:hypothetical protein
VWHKSVQVEKGEKEMGISEVNYNQGTHHLAIVDEALDQVSKW